MSYRYSPPVIWTCDGCGLEVQGWDGWHPTGWILFTDFAKPGDAPTKRDMCPACAAKELAK